VEIKMYIQCMNTSAGIRLNQHMKCIFN
jgi:hypothetical protein